MRSFIRSCIPSVNMDSSPGVPFMHYYVTNGKLFESEDLYSVCLDYQLTMHDIVVESALWIAYRTSTRYYTSAEDAMKDAVAFPFRPFIKGEATKSKKTNANGPTPRLIINTSIPCMLASYLVYNDMFPNSKRVAGDSPITLGFGASKSIVSRVVGSFEKARGERFPAVSNDVGGWEQGFAFQLMLIAVRIYYECFQNKSTHLWRFLYNYALLCADCYYVMPDGEIVRKTLSALMPSGILFTAIFNSLARNFLSRVMGCYGIYMGDDACEYTSDPCEAARIALEVRLNLKVDEQVVLTKEINGKHVLVDGLHFCSAVLYPDGSHSPTRSSLYKSVLSAFTGLRKSTFQELIEANTVRCTTPESFDELCRIAQSLADQYISLNGSVSFDRDAVRNFGDVASLGLTGQIFV